MLQHLTLRTALTVLTLSAPALAQARVVVEPTELELGVGESATLTAHFLGANGERDDDTELMFLSRSRRSVTVSAEGEVMALAPGEFTIIVRTRRRLDVGGEGQEGRALLGERITTSVPVRILPPPIATLTVAGPDSALYSGTSVRLAVAAVDVNGDTREEASVSYTSSHPDIANFDAYGNLHLLRPGSFTATCRAGAASADLAMIALANPVARINLEASALSVRTGDVVRFEPQAYDGNGALIEGVPVLLSLSVEPDDDLGPGASGQLRQDGRFVAETPGLYTAVATCGGTTGRLTIEVVQRQVQRKLKLVGRGEVHDMHTSDLWVWEGVDGRDYCVTGTWGAGGDAIFWDVTDPSNIERISVVTVDARTVNDVKVSANGRLCVISREGASDRKNGLVAIDVTDPRSPKILTEYDEQLTGGVHNVFIDGNEVYALSAGRRYDVIDFTDPESPKKLSQYELDTPGHSIHDVWVTDGLAYSSNWGDGVHIVDVGYGIRGGSPANPQFVASYTYPSGWNHAAFPYRSEGAGRFYVVAGDEAFPYGLNVVDKPTYPRGWLHFIDFTDLENPEEVARYQVPEAGTHNLWIEDDICYVAYYNAGLRVVDVSGELMGDLYRQGREIAWFLGDAPEGHIANAPMAWGPQPYKGNIFFSDWNSGLWCVKLEPEEE